MAHYNIFREQLAIKYPDYGHALWEPSPRRPDVPVEVGDVGFIRRGKFLRLFNALLPADHPSHDFRVPEDHKQLVPNISDHIVRDSLSCNHYCSAGISVERESDIHWHASRPPDDFRRVSFRCSRRRGGAVLSLPVKARREDTLALGAFAKWIVTHIDSWFAFAQRLELGIQRMEEIILVTGFDRTRSWVNIAFSEGQDDAQVSFGVKAVDDRDSSINFQFSPEDAQGGLLSQGPEGRICDLPENQCVFIRGYRVARSRWLLPRHLKAAAGPPPGPQGHDSDSGVELVSTPAITKDPLHLLLDYMAEQAPDCDISLVHDSDLRRIEVGGVGVEIPQEAFRPDAMTAFLKRSNIDIHKVDCDLLSNSSNPFVNASVAKVAMLSTALRNRIYYGGSYDWGWDYPPPSSAPPTQAPTGTSQQYPSPPGSSQRSPYTPQSQVNSQAIHGECTYSTGYYPISYGTHSDTGPSQRSPGQHTSGIGTYAQNHAYPSTATPARNTYPLPQGVGSYADASQMHGYGSQWQSGLSSRNPPPPPQAGYQGPHYTSPQVHEKQQQYPLGVGPSANTPTTHMSLAPSSGGNPAAGAETRNAMTMSDFQLDQTVEARIRTGAWVMAVIVGVMHLASKVTGKEYLVEFVSDEGQRERQKVSANDLRPCR